MTFRPPKSKRNSSSPTRNTPHTAARGAEEKAGRFAIS
nr:MAG TPA: hypothetical protein [Caudoviricetes sp.]